MLTAGTLNVASDGIITGATVNARTTLNISAGANADAIVENGGVVNVEAGATATFAEHVITGQTVENYTMTVHKNTQANENLFTWAGILKVYDGGVASGNVFEASWAGIDISGGRITGTTANVGSGYFNVSAGGIAENTVFSDNWRWGGHMNVYADASVTGTTVNAGYLIVRTGGTATDTLVDGGNLNVDGGGIATGAVLTAGTLNVNAEGAATGVTANADARINVLSGGSLNDATVNLHGNMYVSNGGTATNIKENGGYVEIQEGATATFVSNLITGATMWNGRTMTLHSGTTATDVAMEGSGFIHVYEGGLLENTTLNYSGHAYVSSGGIATGMTLNNGGRIYLSGGALATDTTLQGGDLIVSNGGLVTGKVDIASGGVWLAESATFLIDLTNRAPKSAAEVRGASRITGTKNITVKVSDTQANGKYLLSSDVTRYDGTITVVGSDGTALGTLKVNETVSIGGVDYSLAVSSKTLKLFIGIDVIPGDLYVNPQWDDLIEGSTVTLLNGGKAVYGFDAFSNVDDAVAVMDKDDGTLNIEGGTFAFATQVAQMNVSSGVNVTLQDGTVIGSADAMPGAKINVEDGAVVTVTESGGFVNAAAGATVTYLPNYMSGLYASEYNSASFHSGTSAGSAYAYWYGFFQIDDGGMVSSAYAIDAGSAVIGSGGFAESAYVSSGTLTLMPGAQVGTLNGPYGSVVLSGGTVGEFGVGSGMRLSTTLTPGLNVSGAIDGALFTITGGTVKGLRLGWYGFLDVTDGCTADRVVLSGYSATAQINRGGYGSKINISSGGILNVLEGGLVQSATAYVSGSMNVSSGGRAEAVVLTGNDWAYGVLDVLTGGTASVVTVSSGGYVWAEEDCFMEDMTILSSGQAYLSGYCSNVYVDAGGSFGILGEVKGATVAAGGSMYTRGNGGIRTVGAGTGCALDTIVQSDGLFINGGYASNTQVLPGGILSAAYGLDEGTTVQTGAQVFLDGGTMCNVTFENGATLIGEYGILTGQVTATGSITVSADYLAFLFNAFDVVEPQDTPFVNDLSAFVGSPTALYLAVSGEQPEGTYLLAGGVSPDFDQSVGVYDVDQEDIIGMLTLDSVVRIGDVSYKLALEDGVLSATIGVVDPPEVYVNSEWSVLPNGTPVIPVTGGTTATIGIDAFADVDTALAAVAEDGEVMVVGGSVAFNGPVDKPVAIEAGASLTGKADFNIPISVNGTIVFDTENAADGPQFTGFENVDLGNDAKFRLNATPGVVGATVTLATGASELFKREVQSDNFDFVVGAPSFYVAGGIESYLLDLDENRNLVLSYVACENKSDGDAKNGYLVKKKDVNPHIGELQNNNVNEFSRVLLDDKGTVFENGNYNFVGGDDKADFARITMASAAKLRFSVKTKDSGDKVKISLVSYDAATGKTKTLKSASASKGKEVFTAAVFVDPNDPKTAGLQYFIGVENAGKTNVFYNVELTEDSDFYVNADNGHNNSLVVNKVLNQYVGEFANTPVATGMKTFVQLDTDEFIVDDHGDYVNWVGFGDAADFARISPSAPAILNFTLNGRYDAGATPASLKLTVYSLTLSAKGVWTQKEIKSKTLDLKKGGSVSTGVLYLDRLNVPAEDINGRTGYYVSVQSTNAKKGGEAYYCVSTTGNVFNDADYSVENVSGNGWLFNKKDNAVNGELMVSYVGTYAETWIDFDYDVYHDDYYNFVGFGDTYDYAEIHVSEEGLYNFKINTTGKAKFTVYSMTRKNGKWTQKVLGSQTINDVNGATGATLKKDVKLTVTNEDVRYFVSMQSTDTKKSPEVYYNVMSFPTAVSVSDALRMPETSDALAMSDGLSLGQDGVDALADASASALADQDDKTGWLNIGKLA